MNSLLKDTVIYVIHALQGYEIQGEFMVKNLSKYNLDFTFVTDGDPSLTKNEIHYKYFSKDFVNSASVGGLSCTLNHILAYERLIESEKKYAIIFENDAYFLPNFTQKLSRIYTEISHLEKGFIVSLENTTLRFPSYFQVKKNKVLYRARAGRMAGAYLIDKKGAEKSIKFLQKEKCSDIVDWWHYRLINANVIDMYWAHPPLIEQVSHNGMMSSTISSKRKSTLRRISWILTKMYKTYILRLRNENRIIESKHLPIE